MNTISLSFMENRPIICFGYQKYTHIFRSTDKLGCIMFIGNIRYFACKI